MPPQETQCFLCWIRTWKWRIWAARPAQLPEFFVIEVGLYYEDGSVSGWDWINKWMDQGPLTPLSCSGVGWISKESDCREKSWKYGFKNIFSGTLNCSQFVKIQLWLLGSNFRNQPVQTFCWWLYWGTKRRRGLSEAMRLRSVIWNVMVQDLLTLSPLYLAPDNS